MRLRLRIPSPALVISLIALFVAMGGTGYAALKVSGKNVKNRSLTGKDIKRNSLGRNEVKESSLGKVSTARSADTAASAGSLGGRAASSFAPAGTPPLRPLQLLTPWEQVAGYSPVGFWEEPLGTIHLQGVISGDLIGTTMFVLPPGARPRTTRRLPTTCQVDNDSFGVVEISPNGEARPLYGACNPSIIYLDGMEFRTAP
jgi:hypothetical protein